MNPFRCLKTPARLLAFSALLLLALSGCVATTTTVKESKPEKTRVIVLSDGEVDDECSLVRFLLYTNEFDVEAIVTTSSQYHAHGHNWAGDDWAQPVLKAYAEVYPNLIKHDKAFPAPELLQARTLLGNVKSEGEMDEVTPGSQRIVEVLLDDSDPRPIWIQAWGGTNTLARALKTIEEKHPEKMAAVAQKLRFYFIWEQDNTYQRYIRPQWGKFNIPTIISDQFLVFFYEWKKVLPEEQRAYFTSAWMKPNILEGHGALCAAYKAHAPGSYGLKGDYNFVPGDFRSEGDSAAFLHVIQTGLRSAESPAFGGWGGRYVKVRENTWLDPVPEPGYRYPEGRWSTASAWGREYMRKRYPADQHLMHAYFQPLTRWLVVIQNDFAARADWCVKEFKDANHAPVLKAIGPLDRTVRPGEKVTLAATATDPDGDKLTCKWWQYIEADTAESAVSIARADSLDGASFVVPDEPGRTVHIVLEVSDSGTPKLTRYQRMVFQIQ